MSTDGKDGAAATGRSSVQMGTGFKDGGETVVGGEGLTSKTRVLLNFVTMAVAFSINHACATTLIALASSEFPADLASLSTGTLYGVYTLSALLISTGVVEKVGPKYSLCIGVFGYCAYVGSFLVAEIIAARTKVDGNTSNDTDTDTDGLGLGADGSDNGYSGSARAVVILGSAISGLGAGLLWTAQGQYFESSARLLAARTGEKKEAVTGMLAGLFTAIYLSFEVALKLLSSMVQLNEHKQRVYGIFIALAFGAACMMLCVRNIRPKPDPPPPGGLVDPGGKGGVWADKALKAVNLLRNDRNAVYLAPYNFAFGFAAAMLVQYANKAIITDLLQPPDSKNSYVGFASSIAVGCGAAASVFFGFLTKRIGKTVPMILGNVCFLIMAISFAFIPADTLGTWTAVVPLYAAYGIGRGIWESVNRAIYGDFFPDDQAAAFANITMLSGGSSWIAFFIFPYFSKEAMAGVIIFWSVLGVIGYAMASARLKATKAARYLAPNDETETEKDSLLSSSELEG